MACCTTCPVMSRQRVADAVNLACLAGATDTYWYSSLSICGALASGSLLLLPAYALGVTSTSFPLWSLLLLVGAVGARIHHLRGEGSISRPSDGMEAATALLLVPEAVLRWALLPPSFVEVPVATPAITLLVASLPSPATIRSISAREGSVEVGAAEFDLQIARNMSFADRTFEPNR